MSFWICLLIFGKRFKYQYPKKIWPQAVSGLHERRSDQSIPVLCGLLGLSKQAYYQHQRRNYVRFAGYDVVLQVVADIRRICPALEVVSYTRNFSNVYLQNFVWGGMPCLTYCVQTAICCATAMVPFPVQRIPLMFPYVQEPDSGLCPYRAQSIVCL